MTIRDESEVIREIQGYLLEISYAEEGLPHVKIDGIYESETEESVRAFQSSRNISESGRVDFETYTALYSAYRSVLLIQENTTSA